MSGNGSHQHPGRSVEFLSRLHDGDLDASERARFEAHRTHCAECRRAAIEFEDAISLFRSSHSTPPRADLAARILRKVQSTNRPRAPFSPRFRLDLAAAALLATALLALLVSTPIAVRRVPPPEAPAPEPAARIGSTARDAVAPAPVADSETVRRSPANTSGRAAPSKAPAPPIRRQAEKKEVAQKPKTAEEPQMREMLAKAAEQSADKPVELDARRDESSRAAVAAQSPSLAAGGFEEPPASARSAPLRLRIHSIDGYGAAPPLLPEGPVELSPQERGREYVLLLDSQGVVREVRPSPAPAALSRLHFRPGSRPRRVVVRIE